MHFKEKFGGLGWILRRDGNLSTRNPSQRSRWQRLLASRNHIPMRDRQHISSRAAYAHFSANRIARECRVGVGLCHGGDKFKFVRVDKQSQRRPAHKPAANQILDTWSDPNAVM